MPLATIDIVSPTVYYVGLAITVFVVGIDIIAFVHCVFQRRDAFPALGTLPKGIWMLLLGGGALLGIVLRLSTLGLLQLVGLIAGAVYLIDVRPRIKDLTDGSSW